MACSLARKIFSTDGQRKREGEEGREVAPRGGGGGGMGMKEEEEGDRMAEGGGVDLA